MTFPVFAPGDVLTAADMNAVDGWLIKTQTIGNAVTSVTVSDVFSATYDNYRVVVTGGTATTENTFQFTLGSTVTGYYWGMISFTYAGATNGQGAANGANVLYLVNQSSSGLNGDFCVYRPFATSATWFAGQSVRLATNQWAGSVGGWVNNTTSYTGFTLTAGSGTITGGTIRVYGLRN